MSFLSAMQWLILGTLIRNASTGHWCYSGCEKTPSYWKDLPGATCGESKQSPINIVTRTVVTEPTLLDFDFVKFSDQQVIKSITNNGHAVECTLEENAVEISGGGLNGTYSVTQFHFHWGDTEYHPGSEHTVDGYRHPMEMHIVSLKKGLTATEAGKRPDGIAVLGFFIKETDDGHASEAWDMLTSSLENIREKETEVEFNHNISISDLIGQVNLTKFYRYVGSLTTPNCTEAVVWTVFHEPIGVRGDLMKMFPNMTNLVNVYRPEQLLNDRQVYASPATPLPTSDHSWCYDHHCEYPQADWGKIPESFCDGETQSPININTTNVEVDESLNSFQFTKFDDKRAIKYIFNAGHAVQAQLEENLMEISGGSLGHEYSTVQFHLHWGDQSQDSQGSEHTVDSKRYSMEMHIVNKRKDLELNEALVTPNGLAVLGFFIEVSTTSKSSTNETAQPTPTNPAPDADAWRKLTNYLSAIQTIGSKVNVTDEISIDDLLGSVNRDAYYRYNGSLTTPGCNEVVVWTIFKETIKVNQDLVTKFPKHMGYANIYRPVQDLHSRKILSTKASSASFLPANIFFYLLLSCVCILSK